VISIWLLLLAMVSLRAGTLADAVLEAGTPLLAGGAALLGGTTDGLALDADTEELEGGTVLLAGAAAGSGLPLQAASSRAANTTGLLETVTMVESKNRYALLR
jgi:hypothetical protein